MRNVPVAMRIPSIAAIVVPMYVRCVTKAMAAASAPAKINYNR